MREAALAARGDEVMSLHEATRAAHAQNNQYVMDLQVGRGGGGGGHKAGKEEGLNFLGGLCTGMCGVPTRWTSSHVEDSFRSLQAHMC